MVEPADRPANDRPDNSLPRVVIVGAGFGGLAAAKALRRSPVRVTLIDRHNYHLFQPLLYQVATAGLSPADIAAPIRSILSKQRNVEVVLGTVIGIDTTAHHFDGDLLLPLAFDALAKVDRCIASASDDAR